MISSPANIKIARNTMALYTRMGITMIISFFTTRITLQVLGVEDYGLNNVVASVITMFGFINGSMGTAVQRFYSIEIGKNNGSALNRIFGTGLYLHIIVAGITLIIAEIFAVFFLFKLNIPQERMFAAQCVFQISVISLVLNIINVPYAALLRAYEDFSKVAVLDIVQAFLRLGVLYLLYQINYDKLIVLSTLNFGVILLYIISITVLAKKYKGISFKIIRDKALIKKMLNFISMLIFTVLSSILNKQGIVIVINLFFGLMINAAYAIAFQISNIIETFAMSFKQSVVPQLMAAYGANDRERMNKLMFLGTKVTFLLMMLISIPIIFESDYILNLWLKEPPQYASKFTILILISANINTFSYFIYQAVHASGNIKKQQILTSASYIISILIIYLSFKLGGNFFYAVYIPIIFSIIRNWIIVYSAKETIDLDVKYYLLQIVGRSLMVTAILIVGSVIIVHFLHISFIRLLIVFFVNTIFILVGGYYLLFNSMERKTVINITTTFFSR
jgi:O-antigen/teichoic acid export membrane protein